MKRIVLLSILVAGVPQSSACINDSELPQQEREFRSDYLDTRLTSTEPQSALPDERQSTLLTWGGGLMLLAAYGLTYSGWRRGR